MRPRRGDISRKDDVQFMDINRLHDCNKTHRGGSTPLVYNRGVHGATVSMRGLLGPDYCL